MNSRANDGCTNCMIDTGYICINAVIPEDLEQFGFFGEPFEKIYKR